MLSEDGPDMRYDPWQRTPWWHPRRWVLGETWRRWEYEGLPFHGYYDGQWQYQTNNERAREALEEAYGP